MIRTAVLMATYNGQHFIEKQLDSIRCQTLKPDYVLLRDDGSTDETIKVVNDYIQKHELLGWSIKKNDKNLGWRLNFRELLNDAMSLDVDIVFFSDQDDVWYLNKNKRQVTIMEENPQIELLSADVDIKSLSEEASIPEFKVFSKSQKVSQYPKTYEYQTFRPGWTMALRKSYCQKIIANWPSNYNISHDNLLETTASLIGNGYNLNEAVGLHIRYGDNASGNSKYILNWKSKKSKHLDGLKTFVNFYKSVDHISSLYQEDEKLKERLQFEEKRLEAAQSNTIQNLIFIIQKWASYPSQSSRMRDILFAFKK
ncbi:glycosyltransferase [Streptococcus uberis]|uniref:glycosyltransferase n=1 Tax=Streptococcus uberis TaxID=1349 RepID=UPI000E02ECE9|nr:glycosyltransferase [Streptococcus uberis]SUO89530.1 Glycosyl transferase, group 2 family protein [Streptococcus uberis]